jgi:hypothetical protein
MHPRPNLQLNAYDRVSGTHRVRLRADSTLAPLSDDEFAAGLAALERAATAQPTPTPVVDHLDLLVLG